MAVGREAREEAIEPMLLGMERAMEFVVVGNREVVRLAALAVVDVGVAEGTTTSGVVVGSASISCVTLETEFFLLWYTTPTTTPTTTATTNTIAKHHMSFAFFFPLLPSFSHPLFCPDEAPVRSRSTSSYLCDPCASPVLLYRAESPFAKREVDRTEAGGECAFSYFSFSVESRDRFRRRD